MTFLVYLIDVIYASQAPADLWAVCWYTDFTLISMLYYIIVTKLK